MKKQLSRTKLTLNAQTLRMLAADEFQAAVGGLPPLTRPSAECSVTDCVTCQTCFPGPHCGAA
ncbi:MAG TPA: hypothetical protein VH165_24585 [Kofleriaceae bacterium]|jgi:hypothetical protein|nr:hypothetical protein [Kofleriaceae bacterium]